VQTSSPGGGVIQAYPTEHCLILLTLPSPGVCLSAKLRNYAESAYFPTPEARIQQDLTNEWMT